MSIPSFVSSIGSGLSFLAERYSQSPLRAFEGAAITELFSRAVCDTLHGEDGKRLGDRGVHSPLKDSMFGVALSIPRALQAFFLSRSYLQLGGLTARAALSPLLGKVMLLTLVSWVAFPLINGVRLGIGYVGIEDNPRDTYVSQADKLNLYNSLLEFGAAGMAAYMSARVAFRYFAASTPLGLLSLVVVGGNLWEGAKHLLQVRESRVLRNPMRGAWLRRLRLAVRRVTQPLVVCMPSALRADWLTVKLHWWRPNNVPLPKILPLPL